MALALAMVMILAMGVPVMADQTQPDGSITVKSPVLSATYAAYKIFDMTTNADNTSFSYTISSDNPFYAAVVKYANAADETDADGLTLTKVAGSTNPEVFNISATDDFDAQDFGVAMRTAVEGTPAVEDDPETPEDETAAAVAGNGATAIYPDTLGNNPVTIDYSDEIQFTQLGLGYYLFNATYPSASATVKIPGTDPAVTFTNEDTEAQKTQKINDYVTATVTDAYVNNYIDTNDLERTLPDGSKEKITSTNATQAEFADIKQQLINTLTEDTTEKVNNALANALAGNESDINVKEPILVFVDSTTPDAVINEKNEIPKWDVPVNPEGYADVTGLPEHGEPSGGKNIIVGEDGNGNSIYADWSEANTGESVHYQLRINAMNFIRESNDDTTINQAKEYWLADYQNANMTFDTDKKLLVTIVDENGNKVTDTTNALYSATDTALDYTDQADDFFMNDDGTVATTAPADIFAMGDTNKGIMVPWVKVTTNKADLTGHPIYTTNKVVKKVNGEIQYQKGKAPIADGKDADGYKVDADGYLLDKDNAKIPEVDEYYVYSIYNSDVTIVVDYWMILGDKAVVDDPGNKNFAQYAYTPVEPEDTEPKNPNKDTDEPTQKKEKDEATVYTFALAWVKVNKKAETLANATFELPFYVKKAKDGDAYVYAFETLPATFADGDSADNYTNSLTTPVDGVITIKGVEQGTYSIKETEAPVGYNILTEPFDVEAKKSGDGVTTKTETIIYLDAQGNITDTQTTTTVTANTDTDSTAAVPVYEFNPIVNQQGTELPSTGGIGTTIFYVIGAILVIGGGIVLITRRRMSAR